MKKLISRAVVASVSTVFVLGLSATPASAAHEDNWTEGCRGYWYNTSGHMYCKGATKTGTYEVTYTCSVQGRRSFEAELSEGFVGKILPTECAFNIEYAEVTFLG